MPKEVEVKFDEIPEKIDFNYHVKPILSDRCYSCHGPDEKSRRAGLRLDLEKTAFMQLSYYVLHMWAYAVFIMTHCPIHAQIK